MEGSVLKPEEPTHIDSAQQQNNKSGSSSEHTSTSDLPVVWMEPVEHVSYFAVW